MIFFAENLRTLRNARTLTQQGIADALGLKKSAYANYETGVSSPNYEVLKVIADYFSVTADELLYIQIPKRVAAKNKELVHPIVKPTVNPITEKGSKTTKKAGLDELRLIEADVKKNFGKGGNMNVYDLDGKAAAGKAIQLLESDKVKDAPTLALPELGHGIHIRITAEGDSMFPTVKPGDKPVGTWIANGFKGMHEGAVHLVIDNNDEIVVKRLYFGPDNTLRLESDNEMYRPYFQHLTDFQAIFQVRMVHSSDMRPYMVDVRRDIRQLRGEMEEIRALIAQK